MAARRRECEAAIWEEYDRAADWCAKRGLSGEIGTALYDFIGGDTMDEINADPDAFAARVRGFAYARAMARHGS